MSDKIKMSTPLVELDGDEMTRFIWQWIKEILIKPHVELKSEYYDLGLKERERTGDRVTVDAANAIKKYGVGVKCATITPNTERVKEYGLSEMYKSPNATLRSILDGTVFRTPITVAGISPYIQNWQRPITIARHAYGDLYKNVEMLIDGEFAGSKVELVATSPSGKERRELVHDFVYASAPTGVIQGIHNTDASIESFAHACMRYALDTKQDLWFGAKDTISKTYERHFRDVFDAIFKANYAADFETQGLQYFYSLIDDIVARVIRSEGGFIWACRNYDGDVMSDMVATAFGSLAMMTSVLVSPAGYWEFEAAHGTVQRHYYQHLEGKPTSTNSMATIFAWSGALRKRGELDDLSELVAFSERLEKAAINTVEDGIMTGDLYVLSALSNKTKVGTEEFLHEVAKRLID